MLTVELDRRAGEDSARVTVRRILPLEDLAQSTAMTLVLTVDDATAIGALARMLEGVRGGRGTIHATVPLADGGMARLTLGADFRLDHELAGAVGHIPGIRDAALLADAEPIARSA